MQKRKKKREKRERLLCFVKAQVYELFSNLTQHSSRFLFIIEFVHIQNLKYKSV